MNNNRIICIEFNVLSLQLSVVTMAVVVVVVLIVVAARAYAVSLARDRFDGMWKYTGYKL